METTYPRTVHEFLRCVVEPAERRVRLHLHAALEDLRDLARKNPDEESYITAVKCLERQLPLLEQLVPEEEEEEEEAPSSWTPD